MNDDPKDDECARCGGTPTECTDGDGARLCAQHGRAEHVKGGDPAWDEDAPQWAQLLGLCVMGGPGHDAMAFSYCAHGRPVCHSHTPFFGGRHDLADCGAAGLRQDQLPPYFRDGFEPDDEPDGHDTLREQREPA